MKTILTFSLAFLTMGFMPDSPVRNEKPTEAILSAEMNAGFSFFRTHRQGRFGVTSAWGMSSENGIMEYWVERTYEDPSDPYANWEPVAVLPCSNGRSYKFTDENVFPGYISYRIAAMRTAGGEIHSPVSTVHIISR